MNDASGLSRPLIRQVLIAAGRSRIVVGVDGSLPSVDALRWALREAGPLDATVEAVVAWDFPVTYGIEFGALDVDWAGNAAAALRDALRAAPRPAGRPVTAMVIRGRPVDVLVAAAADADLLVIGSPRGQPGPAHRRGRSSGRSPRASAARSSSSDASWMPGPIGPRRPTASPSRSIFRPSSR